MRYLVTMNMPAGNSNNPIHQMIADHPAESAEALCEVMCEDPFIVVRQWYYDTNRATGERIWMDRGEVVLNTSHIGKVVPFREEERDAGSLRSRMGRYA